MRNLAAAAITLAALAVPSFADADTFSPACTTTPKTFVGSTSGGTFSVEGLFINCRSGSSHKAIVVAEGAATTNTSGNTVFCQLNGEFKITDDGTRDSAGVRAGSGDRIKCEEKLGFRQFEEFELR